MNDVTRTSDGVKVALKIVKPSTFPYEVDIATFCCSKHLISDPHNHCVPIYDVLTVPGQNDEVILVMPMLRDWDEHAFATIGEGVEFFSQLFEVWETKILYLDVLVEFPDLIGLAIYA
jgi:hypothetical protein